jgi:hypothetical protein
MVRLRTQRDAAMKLPPEGMWPRLHFRLFVGYRLMQGIESGDFGAAAFRGSP